MLRDLLFPKFCCCCGYVGTYICTYCASKLSYFAPDVCIYCHRASAGGLTHPACCRRGGIQGFVTIFHYNTPLKRIIKNIKYRRARAVWGELVSIIDPRILTKLSPHKRSFDDFVIQPIPLHPIRKKERGFNQADLVAQWLSLVIEKPVVDQLVRIKHTPAQAQLSRRADRHLNMQSAFDLKPDAHIDGRSIILVDDIVTSGSTVKSAAATLLKHGALRVYVFSLAKG